jgi:hypothetical protein
MSWRHALDLPGNHCRFLMWDDTSEIKSNRLIVCGKPGYPYCPDHRDVVYHKRQRRKEEQQHRPQVCFR